MARAASSAILRADGRFLRFTRSLDMTVAVTQWASGSQNAPTVVATPATRVVRPHLGTIIIMIPAGQELDSVDQREVFSSDLDVKRNWEA